MATSTLAVIEQRFGEALSDWLTVNTTTNITTDNSVISTELQAFDGATDDYFNGFWVYIDGINNDNVIRQISDYATSTGTLTVRGAALSAEEEAVTIRVQRFSETDYLNAINRAIQRIYPALHKKIDDLTLITGNILPNAHFEDQSTSGTPDLYSYSSASGAKETTEIRGGVNSIKVTASGAAGYMTLKSSAYPRLLDLMGKTVSAKVWASPQTANDASIKFYTKQADGTEQNLSSSTSNPAGEFTLLDTGDVTLNDDLVEVEIRFPVATNGQYVIFDDARVTGHDIWDLMLPLDLQKGALENVYIQSRSYSDDACDDLHPRFGDDIIHETTIYDDGTYKYLHFDNSIASKKRIRLQGYKPLSSLSSQTDTITLDAEKLDYLVALSAVQLYRMRENPVSSEDKGRYHVQIGLWEDEVRRLSHHRMSTFNRKLRSI